MNNIKKYQNLKTWVHWLLMTVIVERCPSKHNSRESILSGSLKNCETKICIKTHKTKNIYCNNYHIVLYGCETWAVTVQVKSSLEMWGQNVLSKMQGPVKDQYGQRIRSNDELQFMCRKPNIVTTRKVRIVNGLVIDQKV